jgi:hypothetical protein
MTATEDGSASSRSRASAHKLIQIGLWAGLCGAVACGSLVAVGTSAPLFSPPVAEFVLRWAIVIGLSAVLLATVYWEVR